MISLLFALTLSACDVDDLFEKEEEAIAIEDLPAAVIDAIEDEWPGSELIEAEREGDVYEVEFTTADGVLMEAELEEDGTILDYEIEDEGDDEDED